MTRAEFFLFMIFFVGDASIGGIIKHLDLIIYKKCKNVRMSTLKLVYIISNIFGHLREFPIGMHLK